MQLQTVLVDRDRASELLSQAVAEFASAVVAGEFDRADLTVALASALRDYLCHT